MHIGQGSHVVATMLPSRCQLPVCLQPIRRAFTSAWAVLSMVVSTVLCAVAIPLPACSIAQPKGLLPVLNPSRVCSIARRINSSGFIAILQWCGRIGWGTDKCIYPGQLKPDHAQ